MRSSEVQNWHFVNAAIFNFVNLGMDGHALHVYSHDGNPRRNMLTIGPDKNNGVVLAPGNRASVLVQAGEPGTYYLRTLRFEMGRLAILAEDILAEVIVVDAPLPMTLPSGPLPVPAGLAPITDEELASAGGLKRNIVMRTVFNDSGEPITNPPASALVHPGGELDDWVFQTGPTTIANKVFALGSATGRASTSPGLPGEYIPFHSTRALKQTVALGSVEEWTLLNMNNIRHPFHIHVNPFQVVSINGVPVDPYWADTIGLPPNGSPTIPTSVTFRTRFRDFTGLTVMHCHMLTHEDMGMMQAVEIV
jgi:FtsP/CotA-like multicopper oxidase with cupredoxin domain